MPPSHRATPSTGNPVPRLLVRLRGRKMTGAVHIYDATNRRSVIYVRQGRPVHVEGQHFTERLGDLLVEEGMVPGHALAGVLELQKETGGLLGELLCQRGLISRETLREMLCRQLRRKVASLFGSEPTSIEIAPCEHPFAHDDSSPGVALEPLNLIFPAIQASYSDERLVHELAPLAAKTVRLKPTPAGLLEEAGFLPSDGGLLLSLLGSGVCLQEAWLKATGPSARQAKVAVLTLHYLDMLEVSSIPGPPGPKSDGGKDAAPPALRLSLSQALKLGEAAFQKNDLGRAEKLFELVLQADPSHRRARAFLSWIRLAKKPLLPGEGLAALNSFRDAVGEDPDFGYGYYFIGELLLLREEREAAAQSFRAALKVSPGFHEAERQLRLIETRKRSSGSGWFRN